MGLRNVSASQLTTFKRCERRWYYDKIVRVPRESTNSQRRGTAIHHALEVYVNTGEILEEVRINEKGRVEDGAEHVFKTARFVNAALPYLPPKEQDVIVECEMSLKTLDGQGPPWLGYIDLLTENQVIDYKTTSDLRYAKTPGDLQTDTQLCSYAKFMLDHDKEAESIKVTLIYLETRNKIKVRTKEVSVVLTRDRVMDQWQGEQTVIKKMLKVAALSDVEDTEFNPAACRDYGGCQYKDMCSIPKQGRVIDQKEATMTMKDFLTSVKKNKDAAKEPKAEGPKVDSIVPPDSPKKSLKAQTAAKKEAKKPVAKKEPKPAVKKPAEKKQTKEPSADKTFCLFIDCMPDKGCDDTVLLDDWLFKVVERLNNYLQTERGIADYWLLPFAEQKAMFAAAVVEAVKENPPNCMTVRTGTQQTNEALAMLIPFATMVVRGAR